MSVGLYMDVHVHSGITTGLRVRGVDVLTAQGDGTDAFSDMQLIDRATSLDRVLFSHDADMPVEAVERQRTGKHFSGIIYAHQMQVTIGRCIEDLELIAKVYEPHEIANQLIYLPL